MKKLRRVMGCSIEHGNVRLTGTRGIRFCVLAEEEDITITMVESLTSAERTAIIREIADKYEEEHPNITIEIVSPPLENADAKITQMLMNGSGCDIVESRDLTIPASISTMNGLRLWTATLKTGKRRTH